MQLLFLLLPLLTASFIVEQPADTFSDTELELLQLYREFDNIVGGDGASSDEEFVKMIAKTQQQQKRGPQTEWPEWMTEEDENAFVYATLRAQQRSADPAHPRLQGTWPPNVFPPVGTLMQTIPGPGALAPTDPQYEASIVRFCCPHPALEGAMASYIVPWLNEVQPNKTALVLYTGVIEEADQYFLWPTKCHVLLIYSFTISTLISQGQLRPLNSFFPQFQAAYGIQPESDFASPSYNDLYDGKHWWGTAHIFQNLALSVNTTTLAGLDMVPPPPISNSSVWPLPYGTSWTPAAFRDSCIALSQAGVEECWISEECMIDSQIPAMAEHYGATTITENGTVGWRDQPFIDFLVDILMPIMQTSKPMVARWINLGAAISQEYIQAPDGTWPPSRTYYIPRGTCSLASRAFGYTTLFSGAGHPEMKSVFSPGIRNLIQTWAWAIGAQTTDEEAQVAWSFLSWDMNCQNPTNLNLLLSTKTVPTFTHCIQLPQIQAMIASNPSISKGFQERQKSFTLTAPQSQSEYPLVYRYDNDSCHLILVTELWKCMWGIDDVQQYFNITPYSQLGTRWGRGGVQYPTLPGFDARACATKAANRAADQIEYTRKPQCVFPTNAHFDIGDCDASGVLAGANVALNEADIEDEVCLATAFAYFTLAKVANRTAECPYITRSSSLRAMVVAVTTVLMVIIAAVAAVWYQKRRKTLLKASSWLVSMTGLLVGNTLVVLAPVMVVTGSCAGYYGVLSTGLFVRVGCLMAKLLRLYRMFSSTLKRHKVMTDVQLHGVVGGVAAANWVCLAIWAATRGDAMVPTAVQQFGDGTVTFPVLQCNDGQSWVLGLWVAVFAVCWLVAIGLGIALRDLQDQFADHKYLTSSCIVFALVGFVMAFLLTQVQTQRSLELLKIFVPWVLCFGDLTTYYLYRMYTLLFTVKRLVADRSGSLAAAPDIADVVASMMPSANGFVTYNFCKNHALNSAVQSRLSALSGGGQSALDSRLQPDERRILVAGGNPKKSTV